MGNRPWLKSDEDLLEEKWGNVSIPAIAKLLNRTVIACKLKALKMGLNRHIHSGEYVTCNQLFTAMGLGSSSYTRGVWEHEKNMPIEYKKSIKMKYKIIYLKKFWKWAEENKTLIDFVKFEENMLGEEPQWVKEKRKADFMANKFKKSPWTKTEDSMLQDMLNSYSYTYRELSLRLLRTEGAIKRRMVDLKLKQRPLKASNHNPWTDEEVKTLEEMYYQGYKSEVMAEKINRSALAINGKIEAMEKNGKLLKRTS
jgi:hypothetical protein